MNQQSQALALPRLKVRRYGDGPELLLLHGLGSSGEDWAFQIGPLSAQHQLIVPDLRGCGASDLGSQAVSIASHAEEMWQLLDRLGVAEAHLGGFSMGGAVALEMALQQPKRVRRLVTINSLPSYRVDHWRKWFELHVQLNMVRILGLPRTARLVGSRLFPDPHQAAMRQRVIDVLSANPVEPYVRSARALAQWCAAERVANLRVPMLMLAGEHDYTGLAEKRVWAQRMGARLAVVAGSRHGTPFDSIGATNRSLLSFLTDGTVPENLRIDSPSEAPRAAPVMPAGDELYC